MMKSKKYAGGGKVTYHEDGDEIEPQASSTSVGPPTTTASGGVKGVMDAATKLGKSFGPSPTSNAGVDAVKAATAAQTAAEKAGQSVAGSTQALARGAQNSGFKPGAVPGGASGTGKYQFNKGGSVKKVGAGTGLARLRDSKVAAKVPAKTEI